MKFGARRIDQVARGGTLSGVGIINSLEPWRPIWPTIWRRDRGPKTAPQPSSNNFFPGLDLLRGFAAISVVVCHVIAHFQWNAFPAGDFLYAWFRAGWMGVDLFFVISGFVITLSALKLLDSHPADFRRIFRVRRLARIVPLHYLTCLIYVVFLLPVLMFLPDFWKRGLAYLMFVQNWSSSTVGLINGPNWSLAVEMQFYVMIFLVAPWLRRLRPVPLLAGCIAVSWTWRGVMFFLYHGRQSAYGTNLTWLATSQLPGALDEFGFGISLAMLLHSDAGGRLARVLHATRWLWPVATVLIATVTMRIFWKNPAIWMNWKMVVFWRTLLAATCCSAVISICAINDRSFLTLTTPMRYLGKISYGIYLWHILVITALKPVLSEEPALACGWVLGLTLLLASLSWHFFEKPIVERFTKERLGSQGSPPTPNLTLGIRLADSATASLRGIG